jgi:hypothetical protein
MAYPRQSIHRFEGIDACVWFLNKIRITTLSEQFQNQRAKFDTKTHTFITTHFPGLLQALQ